MGIVRSQDNRKTLEKTYSTPSLLIYGWLLASATESAPLYYPGPGVGDEQTEKPPCCQELSSVTAKRRPVSTC